VGEHGSSAGISSSPTPLVMVEQPCVAQDCSSARGGVGVGALDAVNAPRFFSEQFESPGAGGRERTSGQVSG